MVREPRIGPNEEKEALRILKLNSSILEEFPNSI